MAAADGARYIKNATNRVYGVIKLTTTHGPLGGALTTPDAEISKDGGAFADCTDEAHDIGTTGFFYVDLTATECTASHVTFQQKCSDANAITYIEQIRFEPCLDSGVAQAGTATSIQLRAAATDANFIGNVVEKVRGTGAGESAIITAYVAGSNTATVDRTWTAPDSTTVYKIWPQFSPALGSTGSALADLRAVQSDTNPIAGIKGIGNSVRVANVNDPSATASSFITDLTSAVANNYRYCTLTATSGDLTGVSRPILTYDESTFRITLSEAFPSAIADGTSFKIEGYFR